MLPVAAGGETVLVLVARWLVVVMVPWGLLLLGPSRPSAGSSSVAVSACRSAGLLVSGSSSVAVSVCRSAGLLVSGSAVAAAPLFLPEEAHHVPACVACHTAGPSWCWVQAVRCWPLVVLGAGPSWC